MHRVIFILGCLLVLGGLACVLASITSVGANRELALTLSGATGFVGGCVILVIGLALAQLQDSLRDSAAATLSVLAQRPAPVAPVLAARTAAAEFAPATLTMQPPDFLRRAPAAAAPPAEARSATRDALVMSILEETGPEPEAAPAPRPAAHARDPYKPPSVASPTTKPPERVPAAATPVTSPAPAPAVEDTLPLAIDEDVMAAYLPPVISLHSDAEAPKLTVVPPVLQPLAPQVIAPQSISPTVMAPQGIAPQILALQQRPAAPVPPPPAPMPKIAPFVAPPHVPRPTEVGRYNAGGATYVMFSDGSIEAETETGAYRFASMAELRDYIEQRGLPSGASAG